MDELAAATGWQKHARPAADPARADACRWFEDLRAGRRRTIAEIAAREGREVSQVSRTISLAFLAPDIVTMILDGPSACDSDARAAESCLPTAPLLGDSHDHFATVETSHLVATDCDLFA